MKTSTSGAFRGSGQFSCAWSHQLIVLEPQMAPKIGPEATNGTTYFPGATDGAIFPEPLILWHHRVLPTRIEPKTC